jgi:hypothetical protein
MVLGSATVCGREAPPAFSTCTDFHCDVTAPVRLTGAQWRQVSGLFRSPGTPAGEREAIRRAVARLETLTGETTGTWRDRGRNDLLHGRAGQLDCIAESRNTTTYLRLLERAGLLHWHSVEDRALRRRWLVSDHWTAVIREREGGRRFAVDSWYRDNGEPPCIQPLADWRDGTYPATCSKPDGGV